MSAAGILCARLFISHSLADCRHITVLRGREAKRGRPVALDCKHGDGNTGVGCVLVGGCAVTRQHLVRFFSLVWSIATCGVTCDR